MEQVLQTPAQDHRYADFGNRFLALFLDYLIVSIPIIVITYYNVLEVKSLFLYVVICLLTLSYRPMLEGLYGATLGKMVMKITIVDTSYQKPKWKRILLRNAIYLILGVAMYIPEINMYLNPDFENVHTFTEYGEFGAQYSSDILMGIYFGVMIIEMIAMLIDSKNRSLHDRVAGTYVVETNIPEAQFYSSKGI